MPWTSTSMRDEGSRRKHSRFALLRPDGSIDQLFAGKFASADASNEATRRNNIDSRETVARAVEAVRDVE